MKHQLEYLTNPKTGFPELYIQVEKSKADIAYFQLVKTNCNNLGILGEERAERLIDNEWFVDTVWDLNYAYYKELYPFYRLGEYFYDGPIWKSSGMKWLARVYCVELTPQRQIKNVMFGYSWGFRINRNEKVIVTPVRELVSEKTIRTDADRFIKILKLSN